jgi:galactokinase
MDRKVMMATLIDISNEDSLVVRLEKRAIADTETLAKAKRVAKAAADGLADGRSPQSPIHAFWVPGRVELLGKHTDYAGGSSLLAASQQGFTIVAAPRPDQFITVQALDLGKETTFAIDPNLTPQIGDWSNYPMTVVRRLARNFPELTTGADIIFAGSIPIASGMSSSSALMIGIFMALSTINGLDRTDRYTRNINRLEDLAEYLGTIENGQTYGSLIGDRGVGTFGGSEDHTAILCCRPHHVSRYRYCPTQFENCLALPEGFEFVIASSGVIADKTGSARAKYNRASALAAEVTSLWNGATGHDDPHMAAMVARCDGDPDPILTVLAEAESRRFSTEDLIRRFRHFYTENYEIIPAATDALATGDMNAFAATVNRSQRAGVRLLGNQIAETESLADLALANGALAASAFGAGFGGSVWALVSDDQAAAFLENWSAAYLTRFPAHREGARFFRTRPGPAAAMLL